MDIQDFEILPTVPSAPALPTTENGKRPRRGRREVGKESTTNDIITITSESGPITYDSTKQEQRDSSVELKKTNVKSENLDEAGDFKARRAKPNQVQARVFHASNSSIANKREVDDIDEIPDILDDGPEDDIEEYQIADAPELHTNEITQTIDELENTVTETNTMMAAMQIASIPGIDLSTLINHALHPQADIDEQDELWDWDQVFNQVATEIQLC